MADPVLERLRARLADYDGRATTLLGEAEAGMGAEEGYLDAVIALGGEPMGHISAGATWLLKSALENGQSLSDGQVDALCENLSEVENWAAQLHLCQSMRHLTLSGPNGDIVTEWLKPLLTHPRPFLRAWSLDALAHVAEAHTDHATSLRKALEIAEQDEAASVRARARNLRKR